MRDRLEGGSHAREFGAAAEVGNEFLGDLVELCRVARGLVLDPEFEAAGGADARNCRRRDRDHHAGLDGVARLGGSAHQDRAGVLGTGLVDRGVAILEVGEGDKKGCGVGFELAVDQAEAIDDRAIGHRWVLRKNRVDLLAGFCRARQRGRVGHDDLAQHIALIFIGNEAGGQFAKQKEDASDHDRNDDA